MKIELELDDDEKETLLLALGCATGWFALGGHIERARRCVRLTNKLMAQSPDFLPVAESIESMLGIAPTTKKVQ